jgi:hypothetical protein
LFSNLQTHCAADGTGSDSAWAALRLTGACKSAHDRADQTHSAAIAGLLPHDTGMPADPQTWREGLRTLFCRSLARAISDVIFMPEGQAVLPRDYPDLPISPQLAVDLLPASWLQAGVRPPAAKMDRMRAAIAERLSHAEQAGFGGQGRRGHQSTILDKAA